MKKSAAPRPAVIARYEVLYHQRNLKYAHENAHYRYSAQELASMEAALTHARSEFEQFDAVEVALQHLDEVAALQQCIDEHEQKFLLKIIRLVEHTMPDREAALKVARHLTRPVERQMVEERITTGVPSDDYQDAHKAAKRMKPFWTT